MRTHFLLLPLLFIVSACSPHPGSGGWRSTSTDARFERLEIRYAGNADFYTKNDDKIAAWRCFWGTSDKQIASLKCIDAGDANNEKTYSFSVDEQTKIGSLLLDDQILGHYNWQPPTDPPEE